MSRMFTEGMSRLKKYRKFIEDFNTFPRNIQKIIIKNIDPDLTRLVGEFCLNIDNVNSPINHLSKNKNINKRKKLITALGDRKKSLSKKIKYIRQKGGFIIPLLLSTVAPILSKIISSL